MKYIITVLILGISIFQKGCQSSSGRNYYVDCSASSNGNGSKSKPWNTIVAVNNFTFHPSDRILLKRGTKAIGELWPKGSGNEKAQITIDAYGEGPNPIIDAQGAENSAGIRLSNQEYWTIQNMEVTNNATNLAKRWGILVISTDSLIKHRIHIKNNVVHNVYGSYIRTRQRGTRTPTFYEVGGIYIKASEPGSMNDILIEGNQVTDIVGIGISFWGESEFSGGGMNWDNLSPNVIVRRNTVIRTGADGILVLGTADELIEYNRVDHAGYYGKIGDVPGQLGKNGTDAIAGLWSTRHRDGIVQYNEVSNTRRFFGDGQAFDNDMYVTGTTIFQYNYSHDNEGGFFMDCCNPEKTNTGTIVRYNISQNDGRVSFLDLQKGNVKIYNNVFYSNDTITVNFSRNNFFYNNIFWAKYAKWNGNRFENNAFYGGINVPEDTNKITADPMLVSPGSGTEGFKSLDGYKLQNGSPCFGSGKIISNNGGKDFWKNDVPYSERPNIGAFNGSVSK